MGVDWLVLFSGAGDGFTVAAGVATGLIVFTKLGNGEAVTVGAATGLILLINELD